MPSILRSGLRFGISCLVALALVATSDTGVLHLRAVAVTDAPLGAVSGEVVDGVSGETLADAIVVLNTTGASGPRRSFSQQADSKGRFVFMNVPVPNEYEVHASRPGYLSDIEVNAPALGTDCRFFLEGSRWVRSLKVYSWPTAVVSGTVTDAKGGPLAGWIVRSFRRQVLGGRAVLFAGPLAQTDDLGRYHIGGLPRGQYVISVVSVQESVPRKPLTAASGRRSGLVSSPGSSGAIFDETSTLVLADESAVASQAIPGMAIGPMFFGGTTDASSASAISLDYGQVLRGIDFVLSPVPAWRVSGAIIGPSDLLGDVQLRLVAPSDSLMPRGTEVARTRVAADGRFSFLNVPAGQYELVADSGLGEFLMASTTSPSARAGLRLPGEGPSVLQAVAGVGNVLFSRPSPADKAADRLWATAPVTVDKDVDGLSLVATAGNTISGTLLKDPQSPAPAHPTAAVFLEPAITNRLVTSSSLELTGSAGAASPWSAPREFRIRGLPPGQYFFRSGAASVALKSVLIGGRQYANRPIEVSPGIDIERVTVTVTTETARIAGTVHDVRGRMLGSGRVLCFSTDQNLWRHFGLSPTAVWSTTLDRDGRFSLSNLSAGEYYVVALTDGPDLTGISPEFLGALTSKALRVQVGWAETKSLDLTITSR